MSDAITLTVPMPDNIANRRGNTRFRNVEKKRYWVRCDYLQCMGLVPPPPAAPFARATIRSVMHLGAPMDDDNALHRHKWVLDWLKTRGYIVDDRKKCLTWESFPQQIVKRDGQYRIEITLSPLSPEPHP